MYVNVPWSDTNTHRAIHDTPVDNATTTSISSNWAFDNVKTTVPANAVFTDTNTTYSEATSSALGLVKIGFTEDGKNYPVELSSGKMYVNVPWTCLLYTSPSPRDRQKSRMPSSA